MFRQIYELCMAAFLMQGALLLPMLVLSGVAWFRQMARLAAIEQALGRDRKRPERTLASMIAAMEIIEGFTGFFFVTMAILIGGFLLLALIIALKAD